jgi:hypothetical protein
MSKKTYTTNFTWKGYRGPSSSPGSHGSVRFRAIGKKVFKAHFEPNDKLKVNVKALGNLLGQEYRGYEPMTSVTAQPKKVESAPKRRVLGAYKGKFSVGPEFFEPLSPEELKAWGEQ